MRSYATYYNTALIGLYLGWDEITVSEIGNVLYNKLTAHQGVIAVRSSYKICDLGPLLLTWSDSSTRILVWLLLFFLNDAQICTLHKKPNILQMHTYCRSSQRLCYTRNRQIHVYIHNNARFTTASFGTFLANFGFAIDQNQLIYVIIWFRHDVLCIVRSEARRGHEDCNVHTECNDVYEWPLNIDN